MPLQSDVRLEKSIVIPYEEAKRMEANGIVLPSDGYEERSQGERATPSLIKMQEAVDYETAQRLASKAGVALPIDGSVMQAPVAQGKNMGQSKMPSAILESFRKQPPAAPTLPQNEFNPEFLAKVKEHNTRMNNVLGETATSRNQRIESPAPAPQQRRMTEAVYAPVQQASSVPANIDYPFLSMIIKEAVREVLQEVNIKDVVKEVLKEEREKTSSARINENIVIQLGKTTLAGRVERLDTPKK